LARAADPELHDVGQDGGLVSAMLVYALEHDIIDAALVSYLEGDGSTWKAIPGIARTRADVVASAGSRYTYSANTLAYNDLDKDDERIALVGMSCQSSIPPVMKQRKAGKVARRLALSIGLLCSKTFVAGRDLVQCMLADGAIQTRPGDDDPDAIALMHKRSKKSRKRWPEFALPEARLGV